MNKGVVWFFEVKSNDGIWRGAVGGENIAKLLHRADESKGVEVSDMLQLVAPKPTSPWVSKNC